MEDRYQNGEINEENGSHETEHGKNDGMSLNSSKSMNSEGKNTVFSSTITKELVDKFPHLRDFENQIVLANHLVQVVIYSVSGGAKPGVWVKGIIAAFYFKSKKWQPFHALEQISFKVGNSKVGHFTPIAIDTGIDSGSNAFVTILYADNSGKNPKVAVTWRLSPKNTMLSLVTNNLLQGRSPKSSEMWSMKIHSSGDFIGKYQGEALSYIAINEPEQAETFDQVSLSSFNRFTWENTKAMQSTMNLLPGGLMGLNGFVFLFGSENVKKTDDLIDNMWACHQNKDLKQYLRYSSEDRYFFLQNCLKERKFSTYSRTSL